MNERGPTLEVYRPIGIEGPDVRANLSTRLEATQEYAATDIEYVLRPLDHIQVGIIDSKEIGAIHRVIDRRPTIRSVQRLASIIQESLPDTGKKSYYLPTDIGITKSPKKRPMVYVKTDQQILDERRTVRDVLQEYFGGGSKFNGIWNKNEAVSYVSIAQASRLSPAQIEIAGRIVSLISSEVILPHFLPLEPIKSKVILPKPVGELARSGPAG